MPLIAVAALAFLAYLIIALLVGMWIGRRLHRLDALADRIAPYRVTVRSRYRHPHAVQRFGTIYADPADLITEGGIIPGPGPEPIFGGPLVRS